MISLCAVLLALLNPKARASEKLFSMGGREMVLVPGDAPRVPQISHKSHELDDERSSPLKDPSPRTGYQLVLRKFETQTGIAARSAFYKMNPLSETGILLGNIERARHERAYSNFHSNFRTDDPLVHFLRARQARYFYGKLDPKDGAALVNSDYEFSGISDRAYGYCWGFSTLHRFFVYAAFFDPGLESPEPYFPGDPKRNEAWFRFYEGAINDILEGKPRVIPGFSNFSEFSAVPEIEAYLKLKTMDAWALRAISSGSLKTFFSSTEELGEKGIQALLRALKGRLQRGELPKILFTAADSRKSFGGSLDVHSVIVNGLHLNADGTGRIDLWDINFYFEDLIDSPKFIEIRRNPRTGKRELHYGVWYERKETARETERSSLLGKVRISPEDAAEMGALIGNLGDFCSKRRNLKYCMQSDQSLTE